MATDGGSWRDLTGYQRLVLLVAWLGWIFDSMDATIYNLVLTPALRELLGPAATGSDIAWYGGVILALFLVGWAAGGILFGIVADRFGRARTLVITILIYAVFTGLAGLARSWQELGAYRFFTALGIGGEWASGATLVAEVLPESMRVRAAGVLQSAWAAGYFVAAGVYILLSSQGWRVMFFVGLLPALVALVARLKVKEPERWQKERTTASGAVLLAELFDRRHVRDTLVGAGLAFVAVFGLWGATNWTPSLVRETLHSTIDSGVIARQVSYAVMSLNAGALLGYLVFPPVAERIGRLGAFFVFLAGSAVSLPLTFLLPSGYAATLLLLPVLGFFTNGLFSGFPVYLPELYPTHIRATGAGFCFNAGRVLAASGPFLTGVLVTQLGTYARAASAVALVYVAGLLLLIAARETKGQTLASAG